MKKYLLIFASFLGMIWASAQSSCLSPLVITVGTHSVPSITGTPPSASCGLPTGSNGMWYKYTPTQNALVTISTAIPGQNVNTQLRVFQGGCNNICIASNDDFTGTASQVTFYASAGVAYIIAFDSRWSNAGFDFTVSAQVRNSNLTFTSVPTPIGGTLNNCIVDMNGDYLDDIVSVLSTSQIAIAYQLPTGNFNSVTYNLPNTTVTPSWSIAAGDFDNNGFNDLMYGSSNGICFVKANSTGTGFTADRKPQGFLVQRTNFVDINNDGKLDAFACDDNAPNRYYINDGTNMNHYQGGMGDFPSGGNYGSIWMDYDNDGDMDLYIAKCSGGGSGPGGNIDELHRNNGNGTFTNVSTLANMANPTQTWSSAWGDFNNDGWMDAIIGINSNINGFSKVMKNNGDGTFTDVSLGSGYDSNFNMSREYVAYDFDNDGFLDVLGSGNTIMFGDGTMKFLPNPTSYNLNLYDRPIGDVNNDGFLDIQNAGQILINNGNSNKWLKVTLKGIQSNRNGIGARVEIYGAWGKQIRDVQSGVGFGNMNTLNVHFGIGQATQITKVVVKWPSGIVDTLFNVNPNTTLHVIEGASALDISEVGVKDNSFTMCPNPTEDILFVKTKDGFEVSELKIYELSGKVVMQKSSATNSISIKHLPAGTYSIVVKDKLGNTYSKKIIKK